MTTQMHLAAQYLASAAISFLEKKEDDSHTNLGFSIEEKKMSTHPLNERGDTLSLNYRHFTLDWNSEGAKNSLKLEGATHSEIVKWVTETAIKAGIKKTYSYNFHYELPYARITDDYTFKLHDVQKLQQLTDYLILAQHTLEIFLKDQQLHSDIRIWPHHFDIGAFASFKNKTGFAVGLGLAIPDSMINDYYFYLSGYKGHNGIDTSDFGSLTQGKWYNNGFKGAALPITDIDQVTASAFLEEAMKAYKSV